jgi:hypothetical protein
MRLKVEIEIETSIQVYGKELNDARGKESYTDVTPLSTTVPGRVFPFVSASRRVVGNSLFAFCHERGSEM